MIEQRDLTDLRIWEELVEQIANSDEQDGGHAMLLKYIGQKTPESSTILRHSIPQLLKICRKL